MFWAHSIIDLPLALWRQEFKMQQIFAQQPSMLQGFELGAPS